MVANVFNWLFNIEAGRVLTREAFATLSVFLSFQYLLSVPANSLATTVARFTAYYSEKGEREKHFHFFRQYWWLAWTAGFFFLLLFMASASFIGDFFHLQVPLVFLFAGLLLPIFLVAFERGVLSGQLAFVWVGVLFIVEAGTKLLMVRLSPGARGLQEYLVVAALPASLFAAWFVSLLIARSFHPLPVAAPAPGIRKLQETYKFLGYSFFAGLGAVLIYNLDILLVKHYFSASEAGVYSTLSLMGKTLFFGAGSLISLIVPLTARSVGAGHRGSGWNPFPALLFSVIFGAGGIIWLAYFLFPEFMIKTLLTSKGMVVLPYLSQYSLGMLFLVMASSFVTYSLAKKNYLPTRLTLTAALIEAVLIVYRHQTLAQVVDTVSYTLFFLFVSVAAVEAFGMTGNSVRNNIFSLWRLFAGDRRLFARQPGNKTRVLIFNWRDAKHAEAGGSEVYLKEISGRLGQANCDVTIFTANDGKCKAEEEEGGVRIIRRGGFLTVYVLAFFYYALRLRGKYDIIIDSENGIPFFTPLYARVPVILLVHHVHQDIFFRSLVPPFSWIANYLETYVMPLVYRKSTVVAVSPSTANELFQEIGLAANEVITNGVDTVAYSASAKSETPLVSYVGRLKRYKSIDVFLRAFHRLGESMPQARAVIAGDGEDRERLAELARELGLDGRVTFAGRVGEEEKVKILAASWVMVQPSYLEGWGITCLEANACGTPVLASRVSGLTDAVSEGVSGYFFEYGDDRALGNMLRDIFEDRGKRDALSATARAWSEKHSWDRQSKKFKVLISRLIQARQSRTLSFGYKFAEPSL